MALKYTIEFSETECKIAVLDSGRGGKLTVKALKTVGMPHADELAVRITERSQILREALKSLKPGASSAIVVIPKSFVMVRTVTLPSDVESELESMARFEAERKIPVNPERHIVDHFTLNKRGVNGSQVLICAVDQPIAQEYLDTCIRAGIKVDSIGVSSVGVFNAFALSESTVADQGTVALLNLGHDNIDLIIVQEGTIVFARGSNLSLARLMSEISQIDPSRTLSGEDLPALDALEPHLFFQGSVVADRIVDYDALVEPAPLPAPVPPSPRDEFSSGLYPSVPDDGANFEVVALPLPPPPPPVEEVKSPSVLATTAFSGWLLKVLQEVRKTYEFANREFQCPMISHIYLSGEGSRIRNISQYFRTNFGIDCSLLDPMKSAEISGKAAKAEAAAHGADYAAAIGAASVGAPRAVTIDLVPRTHVAGLASRRQQRSYMVTGLLALVALTMAYMYTSEMFNSRRALLEEYTEKNREDKARVTDLAAKKDRLRIIRENVADDQGALDVLEKISTLEFVPSKVALTSFEYKKADRVRLSGHARALPDANALAAELRKTNYFEDAKVEDPVSEKLRNRGDTEVLSFSITAPFPKAAKTKTPPRSSKTDEADGEEAIAEEGDANGGQ